MTVETKDAWADGKLFTGLQAHALGLIDAIGSQSTAEQKIKELAIIDGEIEWVVPEQPTTFMRLLGSQQDDGSQLFGAVDGFVEHVCTYLEARAQRPQPVQ